MQKNICEQVNLLFTLRSTIRCMFYMIAVRQNDCDSLDTTNIAFSYDLKTKIIKRMKCTNVSRIIKGKIYFQNMSSLTSSFMDCS